LAKRKRRAENSRGPSENEEKAVQFRQKALAKQQSPEELDVPVRLARPQGRLVLAVAAVAVAAACAWAVLGTVTSTLTAPGVLTHAEGSYSLQSPVAGQITGVLANQGDQLASGAALFTVQPATGKERQVRVPAAGRLAAVAVKIGAVVTTGQDLATVERVNSPGDPLYALLYAPAAESATVPAGARVDVTVQTVPTAQYGVLRGTVVQVGRAPQTQQQIADLLGDSALAQQFSAQGEPVAVLVRLDRSGTRSGYAWSTAQGPPYALASDTPVSGSVRVLSQHPVDWLLP
jgi:biotin carboxyl carrier protein